MKKNSLYKKIFLFIIAAVLVIAFLAGVVFLGTWSLSGILNKPIEYLHVAGLLLTISLCCSRGSSSRR